MSRCGYDVALVNKLQKSITVMLWVLAVSAMLGVVALKKARQPAADDPMQEPWYPAPTFSLVDQDDKPFGSAQLAGHIWIADFIFTTCAGQCPMITSRMAALQDKLPAGVRLVTFTVDPETDTPAVLKQYASRYGANLDRWTFVTGPQETVQKVIGDLKLHANLSSNHDQIEHSAHFVLIDAAGNVRNIYDGNDSSRIKQIVPDIERLLAAGR